MSIIANWSAIETLWGITVSVSDHSQCPQKSDILSNSDLAVKGIYASNQLVELDDTGKRIAYSGYAPYTNDLDYDKETAYNSSVSGYIYQFIDGYYDDNLGTVPSDEGVYLIVRGGGSPDYIGTTFIFTEQSI